MDRLIFLIPTFLEDVTSYYGHKYRIHREKKNDR